MPILDYIIREGNKMAKSRLVKTGLFTNGICPNNQGSLKHQYARSGLQRL